MRRMNLPKPRAAGLASLALVLLAGCENPTVPAIVVLPTAVDRAGAPTTARQAPASGSGAAMRGEGRLRPLVERHAARQGLETSLVLAVVAQESGFDPLAVSPVGAQGLMQLMPGTVQHINSAGGATVLDPFDPEQNLAGGTWYLKWVHGQVPEARVIAADRWKMALAGYNGGIGRVRSAIDKALSGAPRSPRARWDDIEASLPAETRRYVPAVLALKRRYGL